MGSAIGDTTSQPGARLILFWIVPHVSPNSAGRIHQGERDRIRDDAIVVHEQALVKRVEILLNDPGPTIRRWVTDSPGEGGGVSGSPTSLSYIHIILQEIAAFDTDQTQSQGAFRLRIGAMVPFITLHFILHF